MSTQTTGRRRTDQRPQLTRFDLFLLVLPRPLFVGFGVASLTAVPPSLGVALGGVPSAALLFYGLFVGGPTVSESRRN